MDSIILSGFTDMWGLIILATTSPIDLKPSSIMYWVCMQRTVWNASRTPSAPCHVPGGPDADVPGGSHLGVVPLALSIHPVGAHRPLRRPSGGAGKPRRAPNEETRWQWEKRDGRPGQIEPWLDPKCKVRNSALWHHDNRRPQDRSFGRGEQNREVPAGRRGRWAKA